MSQQAINEFYKDADEMVMDYAVAVNAEAHDLVAAGADIIQLDEPWLRNDPDAAKRIAVKAINRALEGLKVPTIVHLCFGYAALVPGETKPVGYSFLPQLADTHGRADLHRGGAAQARPRRAQGAGAQEGHARRASISMIPRPRRRRSWPTASAPA